MSSTPDRVMIFFPFFFFFFICFFSCNLLCFAIWLLYLHLSVVFRFFFTCIRDSILLSSASSSFRESQHQFSELHVDFWESVTVGEQCRTPVSCSFQQSDQSHRLACKVTCLYVLVTSERPCTGPRSAVGNVSGYKCVSDCRSRVREFDPGLVPYFRGDWSWNNFYGHYPPFRWFIQEGLLSVTSESMCTNYWLTACSSLPRKKCG